MQEILQFINNHFILTILWIVLFYNLIVNILQNLIFKIKNIAYSEAIYLINKKNAIVIDLRSSKEYYKGHITNSYNLSISDIQTRSLNELISTKTKYIIVVCNDGNLSKYAAKRLTKDNTKQVYILEEGILGWNRRNLPLVKN